MVSSYIVIPLAIQIVAIIFSPSGVGVSPQCSENFVNNPQCGIQFTSSQAIALTPTGYSYIIPEAQQNCSSLAIDIGGGLKIQMGGFSSTLTRIPLIGAGIVDIFDYFAGLGQQTQANSLGVQANNYFIQNTNNGIMIGDTSMALTSDYLVPINSSLGQQRLTAYNNLVQQQQSANTLADACKKASSALLTVAFDAQDLTLMFIGAVVTAGAVASLSALVLNAGATFTIFTVVSLGLIWLILSALAAPTWLTIPRPFGSTIYAITTLGLALGMIGELGSIAS